MEPRTELNLLDYWAVIQRHRKLIFGIAVSIFLIAAVHTFKMPNQYQAKTTFYYPLTDKSSSVSSLAQSVIGKESAGAVSALLSGGGGDLQNYTKGILGSRRVAEIVISNMSLKQRLHVQSENSLIRLVQQSASASISNEGIMQVSVTTNDPKLSADLANGYVDAFRDYTTTSMVSASKKHRLDVEERMAQLRGKLAAAEKEMESFQRSHQTHDFSKEEERFSLTLANLRVEELGSEVALKAAKDGYQKIRNISAAQLTSVLRDPLVSPSLNDPIYDAMRQKLSDVYVQYAQAKRTQTDKNPELVSLKHQLENIESSLKTQIRHQLSAQQGRVTDEFLNFETKISQLEARRGALQNAIRVTEKKFDKYPATGMEYLRLARRLKILEALYTFLSSEYERAKMEEARESPDFQVLDTAVVPDMKVGPNRTLNLFMGLILGIFLGLAAAFFLESTKPRLRITPPPGDGFMVKSVELELAEK